jgi:hypothetical protein
MTKIITSFADENGGWMTFTQSLRLHGHFIRDLT